MNVNRQSMEREDALAHLVREEARRMWVIRYRWISHIGAQTCSRILLPKYTEMYVHKRYIEIIWNLWFCCQEERAAWSEKVSAAREKAAEAAKEAAEAMRRATWFDIGIIEQQVEESSFLT